jgi:hypothetical protein
MIRQLRKDATREHRPLVALACRPENREAVRKIVEEAGVDLHVITDPEAFGLCTNLTQDQLEEHYPEEARALSSQPSRRAEDPDQAVLQTDSEIRISIRPVDESSGGYRKITVEVGPEGAFIHAKE